MHTLVISSSPNKEGLTSACAKAALDALKGAGHKAEEIRLNDLSLCLCRACDNGWGSCREEHKCAQDDAFPDLHRRVVAADAYVLVTPVYFGEPSESMKTFMDRLRRCERAMGERPGGLSNKPLLAVAAAGGSGNGTVHCLDCIERWAQHVGARRFDFVGVTRFTRAFKLQQIADSAVAMVSAKQGG